MSRKGFLNIHVPSLKIIPKEGMNKDPLVFQVKLGELGAKSEALPIESNWNLQFLMQVLEDTKRVSFKLTQGETLFGECRFEIQPFIDFQGKTSVMQSEMRDEDNQVRAIVSLRLTYYSAKYGRLRVRVHEILLRQSLATKAKNLGARFKLGPFVKTTNPPKQPGLWQETIQLIVLTPTANLTIEAVSEGHVIGEFVIYNVEKSGLLKEKRITQNNLFWQQKLSGKIKYEIEHVPE